MMFVAFDWSSCGLRILKIRPYLPSSRLVVDSLHCISSGAMRSPREFRCTQRRRENKHHHSRHLPVIVKEHLCLCHGQEVGDEASTKHRRRALQQVLRFS